MEKSLCNGYKQPEPESCEHCTKEYRVLSVQSHVVSGYVGNRSAVFPLQVLGFEVDVINTVQFSNHLGYPSARGCALDEQALEDLYTGLRENQLDRQYTHLLTGFFRSKPLLLKLADIARSLKETNPGLIYVCDPVMGDLGRMYVHADVLEVYRDVIIPLADVITPNQFEAELLTGITIRDTATAKQAMEALHRKGPQTVIISSSDLGDEKQQLVGYASSLASKLCKCAGGLDRETVKAVRMSHSALMLCEYFGERESTAVCIRMEIPRFPAAFNGTGDLFAALFLAWLTKSDGDLKHSFEATISTMQAVLRRTLEHTQGASNFPKPFSQTAKDLELRLIQSKEDIESPVMCVTCVDV